MLLLTWVFGCALLSKANTLKCYECVQGVIEAHSDNVTECPLQGQQCGAVRITTQSGNVQADLHMKSCLSADQCVEGSVSYGITRIIVTSKCCTSELCNTEPAPAADNKPSPNGRKCSSCNGLTCTGTLDCRGDEDHCITASMKLGDASINIKGCASQQFCKDFAQSTELMAEEVRCCQGDLCNSDCSLSASLLLLLVGQLLASVMLC